jgi:hypothetical protein
MIFVVEALSGERKTANDQIALEELRLFDRQQAKLEKQDIKQHAFKEAVWVTKRNAILQTIKKQASKGEETGEAEIRLEDHEANRPLPTIRPRMLISDITAPAISLHLSERFPYAGLVSDEGGVILSSGAMSNPAMINSIWDSGNGMTDRISRGRTEVNDASLTVYLQVQPGVFEHFLSRQGDLTHVSGNSSRWLYANPLSTQGLRKSAFVDLPLNDLAIYNERIRELLSKYTANQLPKLKTKTLSDAASGLLRWFSDKIEGELKERGRFTAMRGAATKAPENCARLAAVMHEFENASGDTSKEVDVETLGGAIKIIAWHLNQYRMRFAPLTQMERDILDLEECIFRHAHRWENNGSTVHGYVLARYAPSRLRQTNKLHDVALELGIQNKAKVWDAYTRGWRIDLSHWISSSKNQGAQEAQEISNHHPQAELQAARRSELEAERAKRRTEEGYELWPNCFLPSTKSFFR